MGKADEIRKIVKKEKEEVKKQEEWLKIRKNPDQIIRYIMESLEIDIQESKSEGTQLKEDYYFMIDLSKSDIFIRGKYGGDVLGFVMYVISKKFWNTFLEVKSALEKEGFRDINLKMSKEAPFKDVVIHQYGFRDVYYSKEYKTLRHRSGFFFLEAMGGHQERARPGIICIHFKV